MRRDDSGQSLIEAVVLGLGLFVPLIFAVVAATTVHRATLAANSAAHEAARAWSTSPTAVEARARAEAAARRASADYGFDPASLAVSVEGVLAPGGEVTVVTRLAVPVAGFSFAVEGRAGADADRLRSTVPP